jgi:predicted Zn-dependent protease
LVSFVALVGCEGRPSGNGADTGPGGRPQTLSLTPSQELAVGRRAFRDVLDEFDGRILSAESREASRIVGVTARLIRAAEIEPLQQEIHLRVRNYVFEWDVRAVRDPRVNAFSLPAGKMVVFTGLMHVAANDDQLAAVLGHEMAHVLSHHVSERVARERSGAGILRSLSYDRMQESEADHIGVFLMTFAGYDPAQAVAFWERMHAVGDGGQTPEFLSDHPSAGTRIKSLRAWAPDALAAKRAWDEGRIAPAR